MQQKGNILAIFLTLIGLLIVGAGLFFFVSRNKTKPPTPAITPDTSSTVTSEESSATEEVGIEENPSTLVASLDDITGGNSFGTGYVLRENGTLTHKVLANLPDPEGNNFYEGWLVQQTPMLKFFSTGVMNKNLDGNYELKYKTGSEYDEYNFVVITLETTLDATPEKHILEGTAK